MAGSDARGDQAPGSSRAGCNGCGQASTWSAPSAPHPLSLAHGAVASCNHSAWVDPALGDLRARLRSLSPSCRSTSPSSSGSRGWPPGQGEGPPARNSSSRATSPSVTASPSSPPPARSSNLAPTATTAELETLIADAQVKRLMTERQLTDVLDRAGRHRGAPKLRRMHTDAPGLTLVRGRAILGRLLGRRTAAADHQRPDRPLQSRLRLAGPHADRRVRRLQHPQPPQGLPPRPRRNAELTASGGASCPSPPNSSRTSRSRWHARIAEALATLGHLG